MASGLPFGEPHLSKREMWLAFGTLNCNPAEIARVVATVMEEYGSRIHENAYISFLLGKLPKKSECI